MYKDSDYDDSRKIIGYCCYCNGEILEGEGYIYVEGKGFYHYDKYNDLLNCYYEEEDEE